MRQQSARRCYVYSFGVWPDEQLERTSALCELFRMLDTRIEMNFTQVEFERFRSEVLECGITLREIQRVPYVKPEIIL